MKILFIAPYPSKESPSQRFRFEQYLEALLQHGFSYETESFLTSKGWSILYLKGRTFSKIAVLIKGFLKRALLLFQVSSFNYVFIHREAAPFGPPVFEWIIAKIFRKKIIYDFDDAIWLTDKTNESKIEKLIRWRSKISSICRWSYKISCGNAYLCDFARQYNPNVVYNPTTIDTINLHNPDTTRIETNEKIIIGWTGSHSTLKYLQQLSPVLKALEQKYPEVEFLVIANQPPLLHLTRMRFIPWNKETEAEDLARMDIGTMPLPHDEWTKGKCGFKALQYMAMNIPAVASDVGVNASIIKHGETGYLATTSEEWHAALETLIKDSALRKKIGEAGREKVIADYSVLSNTSNFLSLFS